jgi:hypothetical protein
MENASEALNFGKGLRLLAGFGIHAVFSWSGTSNRISAS